MHHEVALRSHQAMKRSALTGHPASAPFRMDTLCVSVHSDWRRETSWLGITILPESYLY